MLAWPRAEMSWDYPKTKAKAAARQLAARRRLTGQSHKPPRDEARPQKLM